MTTTLNAYELYQQRRRGVPVLNSDPTERWYRVARPNGDALYGWGDEIEVDAWVWLLNDAADLTVDIYAATEVPAANLIAKGEETLLRDGGGLNITDELESLAERMA